MGGRGRRPRAWPRVSPEPRLPSFPSSLSALLGADASGALPPHFGGAAAAAAASRAAAALPAPPAALGAAAEALAAAAGALQDALSVSLPSGPSIEGAAPHFGGAALAGAGRAFAATAAAAAAAASGAAHSVSWSGVGGDPVAAAAAAVAQAASALEAAATVGVSPAHYPLPAVAAAVATALAAAAASSGADVGAAAARAAGPPPEPYSPDGAAAHWTARPARVAARAATLAGEAASFAAALAWDRATGGVTRNERARAAQLRGAIERAGPAWIKIAQAVSTRVDVLSPAYLAEVERLQDRVAPFPTEEARAALAAAWRASSPEAVLATFSPAPVASASLGQVYKATLKETGQAVAVKVQRPGVRDAVSLDLFLMRAAAVALDARPLRGGRSTNWTAVIDEWAGRFTDELDYRREAATAAVVARQLAHVRGVAVPAPVPALCTQGVLVTDWVDGERLSESSADDVVREREGEREGERVGSHARPHVNPDAPHPPPLLRSSSCATPCSTRTSSNSWRRACCTPTRTRAT
jgi:aarF domain-containing kinase